MGKKLGALLASLLVGGLVAAGAPSATAAVVERYSLDYYEEGTATDFCGAGLQPTYVYEQTGTGSIKTRGPNSDYWFHEHLRITQSFTLGDKTVTELSPSLIVKDLKIVHNDNGTQDITILLTGASRLVGDNGKVLAKGDGQIRLLVVYDVATDTVISEEVIFGSTGTNDDYCSAILDYWGI